MATGGDVLEAAYNHPTLGSGILYPKANEANTFDVGGIRTEDDTDSSDSSGEPIWKMSRKLGFFEIVIANDTVDRMEYDAIDKMSGDVAAAEWTVTLINGSVFGGTGKPVGDLSNDTQAATFTLKVNCPKWKKIAG